MKIIKCRFIPPNYCVNLFGTIWVRDPRWISNQVINHERIHTRQQLELLFIPFYLLYLLEWLIRLLIYRNSYRAYRNLSMEREAYANQANFAYLSSRRPYAWLRYLRYKRL
ncbi:MAG: hypothetical protein K2H61_05550 [Muribaculaceae bacterium]|nr:hypothetical protein [Muribaculaceae bacterium]